MTDSSEGARSPLRIAVIAHALRAAGGRSVGLNLLGALARVAPQHSYLLTTPADAEYDEVCRRFSRASQITYAHGGRLHRWRFDTVELPSKLREFRPDRILALGNRGFLRPIAPQAVLIHDPHLVYPTHHFGREPLALRLLVAYQTWHLARTLRSTSLVLCQTASMEQRIRRRFAFRGPISRCPNAVSERVHEASAAGSELAVPPALARVDARFRLFCLTRYYGHKNLEILLELFRQERHALDNVAIIVTVAADQHPYAGRFLDAVAREHLEDRIVNVGPLRQDELAAYYLHTDALFIPTLLESFSGTYLEAIRYRRPVLTSDLDFAHEVCGDAALYFDPWNPASIARQIATLRDDAMLRQRLIASGASRGPSMVQTWEQIAAETIRGVEQMD